MGPRVLPRPFFTSFITLAQFLQASFGEPLAGPVPPVLKKGAGFVKWG
ncbi:hypothetical protein FOMG_18627 [Fusarium oxysporum f. sp. melonis 26406]|uniref:Uncharacterized protein n=1 Tax=Fusarium oxysporum f. sp. melonis 26406 TaxID=1089452 RepID=W9YZU8_FUSOX|nr:hypothetical protein FOMG_18627 [Fusarium oxysporum f. sp. melonis 26406]